MRKLLISIIVAMTVLAGCGSKKSQWEYKTLVISSKAEDTVSEREPRVIALKEEQINTLGSEGWELVGCWSETETLFPNFGNDEYHTGIKTNVRTSKVSLIFKRQKMD